MSERKEFDAEKLADLLAKVQAATGPDREVDLAIRDFNGDAMMPLAVAFGANDGCWVRVMGGKPIEIGSHRDSGTRANDIYLPRYTASIDAALALVERMLSGSVWHIMTDYGGLNRAKLGPVGRPSASIYNVDERPEFWVADGETPPLAILAALLTALSSTNEVGK